MWATPAVVASTLLRLGREDEAFSELRKAYDQEDWFLATTVGVTPIFDPLRDDPRFDQLLRKMNYPGVAEPTSP